jgi:hypothetical protein
MRAVQVQRLTTLLPQGGDGLSLPTALQRRMGLGRKSALSQLWIEKETHVDASPKLSPGLNSWPARDSDAITILPSYNPSVLHSQIGMDTSTESKLKVATPAQGITDVASIPHVIAIAPSVQDMSYINTSTCNTSGSSSEVQAVSVRNQPESAPSTEASKTAQCSQVEDLPPSSAATQNNDARQEVSNTLELTTSPISMDPSTQERGKELQDMLRLFKEATTSPLSTAILQTPLHKTAMQTPNPPKQDSQPAKSPTPQRV